MANSLNDFLELRYNIKQRYYSLFPLKRKLLYDHIVPKYCSKTSFYEYLEIKKTDSQDIPADVLKQFAICFNVSMEFLFTDKY